VISPAIFFESLKARGVGLFAGVPDSLLKNFCAYIGDRCQPGEHIITANEGNAVALAAGYHLATGKIGAVYMQNSGLGNSINPLTSLTDPEVYRIPILLIVGWRGEPRVKDAPQHVKQGRITPQQFQLLEIPHQILEATSNVDEVLNCTFSSLEKTGAPVSLLVTKNTFSDYKSNRKADGFAILKREEVLRQLFKLTRPSDLVVSTTGKTSREVFELREERGESPHDFLTVGSMGHTASIALGVALGNPKRRVLCLDGDGSTIMHLGALPIIGDLKPLNFVHVLLNNAAHESVGEQPTVAGNMDFAAITKACGYRHYHQATDVAGLSACWQQIECQNGPVFLEIRIRTGSRIGLRRPSFTPQQNKHAFMEHARV
jgi:phosphonopyruvate decarboxylase